MDGIAGLTSSSGKSLRTSEQATAVGELLWYEGYMEAVNERVRDEEKANQKTALALLEHLERAIRMTIFMMRTCIRDLRRTQGQNRGCF